MARQSNVNWKALVLLAMLAVAQVAVAAPPPPAKPRRSLTQLIRGAVAALMGHTVEPVITTPRVMKELPAYGRGRGNLEKPVDGRRDMEQVVEGREDMEAASQADDWEAPIVRRKAMTKLPTTTEATGRRDARRLEATGRRDARRLEAKGRRDARKLQATGRRDAP